MKVLVTCPPMIGMIDELRECLDEHGVEAVCPSTVQTLSEEELIDLLPGFDGWIIGDDPVTRRVLEAAVGGGLRAAVKWGIGVDNIDFDAASDLQLPIRNTPQMFGREVADLAFCYVVALARETHLVDAGVKAGRWPKPRGVSLAGKTIGLVGLGDIGYQVARRALVAEMNVVAYDPYQNGHDKLEGIRVESWPHAVDRCDFIVLTCALTQETRHMVDDALLKSAKAGVRIVNVARGPLIDEPALDNALLSGQVAAAALDVFEDEPLPASSPLRRHEHCIFGSHNASNTGDAVRRASERAISILVEALR